MIKPEDDLHWFNIPDLPTKLISHRRCDYLNREIILGIPKITPFYIYFYNSTIRYLEIIRHSKKAINFLNKKGVHIFLYEPLCQIDSTEINRKNFYSDLDCDFNEDAVYVEELESIKKYVVTNKLTDVTVHTGDYNVEMYYKKYSPFMKLLCDDIFLKTSAFVFPEPKVTTEFTKKFISLNWRITNHRLLIALYLVRSDCHLSWYYNVDRRLIDYMLWFNLDLYKTKYPDIFNKIINNIDYLNSKAPLVIDSESVSAVYPVDYETLCRYNWPVHNNKTLKNPAPKNIESVKLLEYYRDSFCDLITESRFAQPTGNYSEKTYQAIKNKVPFILVAPPNTLEYLRKEGFHTFSKFWDESYDKCLNHEERMVKIFKIIDYIESLSLDDLRLMKKEMTNILNKNYKVLYKKFYRTRK